MKLFDAQTGELVRSLNDEPAKLADQGTPANFKSLRRAMGSVDSLAFSPDGSLLATCGSSFGDCLGLFDGIERLTRKTAGPGRLKVWDVKTGTLKHDLAGHSYAEASPFRGWELAGQCGKLAQQRRQPGWGRGAILWNPQTGAKIRTISNDANGGTHAIAFSPNSKLVAVDWQSYDEESRRR